MKKVHNLIAGFAGALSLTLLHEGLKRKLHDAPRIDLLGEEAVNVLLNKAGKSINDEKKLYATTLAGDLVANTIYYSAIGTGGKYT